MRFKVEARRSSLIVRSSIATLTVALVAVLVASTAGWLFGRQALDQSARDRVTAVRLDRGHAVEDYFAGIRRQVATLATSSTAIDALEDFQFALGELGRSTTTVAEMVETAPEASGAVADSAESDPEEPAPGTPDAASGADGAADDAVDRLSAFYAEEFLPRLGDPEVDVRDVMPTDPVTIELQSHYLADNPAPIGNKDALQASPADTAYDGAHARHHPTFEAIIEHHRYYDVFLIEPDELRVVYSFYKEIDFGTRLRAGPHGQSGLAGLAADVVEAGTPGAVAIADFTPYLPSYGAPAAFMAAPVYSDEELIGVVAIQIPIDQLDAAMTVSEQWAEVGLGETGEAYLVGSDRLMRSNSRALLERTASWEALPADQRVVADDAGSTVLSLAVRTVAVDRALSPEIGTVISDNYLGEQALSAYAPLAIDGLDWVIVAEIATAEAFAATSDYTRLVAITAVVLAALVSFLAVALSERFVNPFVRVTRRAAALLSPGSADSADFGAAPTIAGAEARRDRQLDGGELASSIVSTNAVDGAIERLDTELRLARGELGAARSERSSVFRELLPAELATRVQQGDGDSFDYARNVVVAVIDLAAVDIEWLEAAVPEIEQRATAQALIMFRLDVDVAIVVGGLRGANFDQADRVVAFASWIVNHRGHPARAGVASGEVLVGLVNQEAPIPGVWGPALRDAKQLVASAVPGEVAVDEGAEHLLSSRGRRLLLAELSRAELDEVGFDPNELERRAIASSGGSKTGAPA